MSSRQRPFVLLLAAFGCSHAAERPASNTEEPVEEHRPADSSPRPTPVVDARAVPSVDGASSAMDVGVLDSALPPSPTSDAAMASTAITPLAPGGTWEVDLTTGRPGGNVVEVTGGKWEGGWRITNAKGERIAWDMGRPVVEGVLEVSVTVNKHPHDTPGKLNWAGLFESATLNQDVDGDIFYARVGATKYGFSRAKSAGHMFDKTEWEPSLGSASDWTVDDRTTHTVRFEWTKGQSIFHDSKGRKHLCPTSICGGARPVDELRYVFIGADKWPRINTDDPGNVSPVGMRFVKLKLTDTKK